MLAGPAGAEGDDMSSPSPSTGPPGDGTSSIAARWMSGLGAFLLVAAAATFVAVRWDEIPDEAKLGALLLLTVTCLGAASRLRARLPVTAAAFLHIGVLLVPIDVAAVGVGVAWDWPEMLLAQGIAVTAACGAAARLRPSLVFRVATWAGVVLLASGAGVAFGLPSGLLLATVALLVVPMFSFSGRGHYQNGLSAAVGWATLAGLAVPLAAAERLGLPGAGVLSDLGLASAAPHPSAALTGAVAASTLFLVAHRWQSIPLALLGTASLLTGAATTWVGLEPGPGGTLVAVAVSLLLAEVTAWRWRRDPFWSGPLNLVARGGELLAALLTLWFAAVVATAPWQPAAEPLAALGASLLALTWLAATGRGRETGSEPASADPRSYWPWTSVPVGLSGSQPFAAAVAAGAAGVLATDGRAVGAVVVLVAAAASVTVPPGLRPGVAVNRVLGVALAAWAPVTGHDQPALALGLGFAGAVTVGLATVDTSRYSGRQGFNELSYLLAGLSLAPLATGWLVAAGRDQATLGSVVAIAGAWSVAALLDRAGLRPVPPRPTTLLQEAYGGPQSVPQPLALVPRLAALVPLAAVPLFGDALFTAREALLVAGLVAGLALLDAVRLDEPNLLLGVGCAAPVALVSTVLAGNGTLEHASVVLTLSTLVWVGTAAALPPRWAVPATASGAVAATAGMLLGLEDAWAASANLLVVGGALIMAGAIRNDVRWAAAGCGAATVGLWQQLALNDVSWSEAYVAPVALTLGLVGHLLRRPGTPPVSSWLTYAPALALVGGAALLERVAGSPSGWHGVIAGVVGVTAVAVGGMWRQAGPLVTGTVLVVAVTAHETLETSPQVPTWAWLATGGAALLGLGLLLERRGTGPVESGRRLVELVNERFS